MARKTKAPKACVPSAEEAERVLRKRYWDEVRSVCESAVYESKQGHLDLDDEEAVTTWLDQTIDGHENVIYTGNAIEVLLWSDHQDAYFEDMGEVPESDGGGINWSALAYAAMRADVQQTWDAGYRG